MRMIQYRGFMIYYEEKVIISIISIRYGIEHIRLFPKISVSDCYLYMLVDNLIEDSIKAHYYYYNEVLDDKQKKELREAYHKDKYVPYLLI